MASIPFVNETDAETAALLKWAAGRREAVGAMHRQMAHIPPLLEAFELYSTMIRSKLPLDRELWGLVILRTVQTSNVPYQWRRCVQIGRRTGMDDAKIIELWNWQNSDLYSERQKAAFAIVDEHCLHRPARRVAAEAALGLLTAPEIVAVCTLMGWFALTFAFIEPLRLSEDDPDEPPELVALDDQKFNT